MHADSAAAAVLGPWVFGPSLALAEYAGTLNRVIWKTAMMASGTVTVSVTLQRNESIVVIKDVPAQVRKDCGDYHLDGAATKRISALTEEAVERHAEVEVLWYAA